MSIEENIKNIRLNIKKDVSLIAVSKTFSSEKIREAYSFGVFDFGENYLDEALAKIKDLESVDKIRWHYIGRIQSKKINKMVGAFNYIHTVASIEHSIKIDRQAKTKNIKQKVLLQLKHENDSRDYGILFSKLKVFLDEVVNLTNIQLSGLMYLPPQDMTQVELEESFKTVETLFRTYKEMCRLKGHEWDMISMGMSEDYESAIQNGSTHIRIGRGVFGTRT